MSDIPFSSGATDEEHLVKIVMVMIVGEHPAPLTMTRILVDTMTALERKTTLLPATTLSRGWISTMGENVWFHLACTDLTLTFQQQDPPLQERTQVADRVARRLHTPLHLQDLMPMRHLVVNINALMSHHPLRLRRLRTINKSHNVVGGKRCCSRPGV